jgi:hypothetical protein
MKFLKALSVSLVFTATIVGCGGGAFSAAGPVPDSGGDSDPMGQDAASDQKVGDSMPAPAAAPAQAEARPDPARAEPLMPVLVRLPQEDQGVLRPTPWAFRNVFRRDLEGAHA